MSLGDMPIRDARTQHEALPADIADQRIFGLKAQEAVLQVLTDLQRVLLDLVLVDRLVHRKLINPSITLSRKLNSLFLFVWEYLQDGAADGAGDGIAAVRVEVDALRQRLGNLGSGNCHRCQHRHICQ